MGTATSTRQRIGNHFEIVDPERDLLGRGGVGDVYRGRDISTGELVAIKVLRPEVVSGTPDAVARFIREGEALRELDHHRYTCASVRGHIARGASSGVRVPATSTPQSTAFDTMCWHRDCQAL
ncbi:MAG: hypothetical protein ISS56_10005 [Anaerolineae bacterium]|nr:hypothetical protein [Anaerolineae bacterium]